MIYEVVLYKPNGEELFYDEVTAFEHGEKALHFAFAGCTLVSNLPFTLLQKEDKNV